MYQVVKRDGTVVDFDITKIANAIKKAFEATETDYNDRPLKEQVIETIIVE